MTTVLTTLLIALLVGFAVTLVANICTTVYLHRALAHRGVTLAPSVQWVFRFLLWITTGIQPRQWLVEDQEIRLDGEGAGERDAAGQAK